MNIHSNNSSPEHGPTFHRDPLTQFGLEDETCLLINYSIFIIQPEKKEFTW